MYLPSPEYEANLPACGVLSEPVATSTAKSCADPLRGSGPGRTRAGTISERPSRDQSGPKATADVYVALVTKSASVRSPTPSEPTSSSAAASRRNATVRPSGENTGDSRGLGPTARR